MLDFARTHITIDAAPDRFAFATGKKQFSLEPFVYLDPERLKLVAVGELPESGGNAIRVELFRPQGPAAAGYSKAVMLTFFFAVGIGKCVTAWYPVLKPLVTLTGADRFDALLCGYQRDLFLQAALDAGAARVAFH